MSDQQLYTLKQINELVQVGFIKADNTSLPKIGLTKPDFLNTIFLSQISSWTGQGMKVKIRTTEKCKDCGLLFNEKNKFNCKFFSFDNINIHILNFLYSISLLKI